MGRLYIFKMQSLQCRQLPCPQHPSAPPQLCPDSTLSPGLISLPSHAPIPGFMQPGWMFNQDNACARKQCSFLLLFWSFSLPPTNLVFSQIAHGSSWPPMRGASSRDVPGTHCWERAEWDSPFWQHSVM